MKSKELLFFYLYFTAVKLPLVNSASDNKVLVKILQSVDAATNDEHLFEVTLKLLKSICSCMHETLKAKEERINFIGETNSVQLHDSEDTNLKEFDLYKKIYNNTCHNLKEELSRKLMHTDNATLDNEDVFRNGSKCGKRFEITTETVILASTNSQPVLHDDAKLRLENIIFKTLIETKKHHNYTISRSYLFGKNIPFVNDDSKHSIIVILTLHPDENNCSNVSDTASVSDLELNNTLYSDSPVNIDLIDTNYNPNNKDSEEHSNSDIVSECILQSIYMFLLQSEKSNSTKVFKLLRKNKTIKVYIEVITDRNHTDYSTICCIDGLVKTSCKKYSRTDTDEFEQNYKMTTDKNHTSKDNYKETVSKIRNLVQMYSQRLTEAASNKTDVSMNKVLYKISADAKSPDSNTVPETDDLTLWAANNTYTIVTPKLLLQTSTSKSWQSSRPTNKVELNNDASNEAWINYILKENIDIERNRDSEGTIEIELDDVTTRPHDNHLQHIHFDNSSSRSTKGIVEEHKFESITDSVSILKLVDKLPTTQQILKPKLIDIPLDEHDDICNQTSCVDYIGVAQLVNVSQNDRNTTSVSFVSSGEYKNNSDIASMNNLIEVAMATDKKLTSNNIDLHDITEGNYSNENSEYNAKFNTSLEVITENMNNDTKYTTTKETKYISITSNVEEKVSTSEYQKSQVYHTPTSVNVYSESITQMKDMGFISRISEEHAPTTIESITTKVLLPTEVQNLTIVANIHIVDNPLHSTTDPSEIFNKLVSISSTIVSNKNTIQYKGREESSRNRSTESTSEKLFGTIVTGSNEYSNNLSTNVQTMIDAKVNATTDKTEPLLNYISKVTTMNSNEKIPDVVLETNEESPPILSSIESMAYGMLLQSNTTDVSGNMYNVPDNSISKHANTLENISFSRTEHEPSTTVTDKIETRSNYHNIANSHQTVSPMKSYTESTTIEGMVKSLVTQDVEKDVNLSEDITNSHYLLNKLDIDEILVKELNAKENVDHIYNLITEVPVTFLGFTSLSHTTISDETKINSGLKYREDKYHIPAAIEYTESEPRNDSTINILNNDVIKNDSITPQYVTTETSQKNSINIINLNNILKSTIKSTNDFVESTNNISSTTIYGKESQHMSERINEKEYTSYTSTEHSNVSKIPENKTFKMIVNLNGESTTQMESVYESDITAQSNYSHLLENISPDSVTIASLLSEDSQKTEPIKVTDIFTAANTEEKEFTDVSNMDYINTEYPVHDISEIEKKFETITFKEFANEIIIDSNISDITTLTKVVNKSKDTDDPTEISINPTLSVTDNEVENFANEMIIDSNISDITTLTKVVNKSKDTDDPTEISINPTLSVTDNEVENFAIAEFIHLKENDTEIETVIDKDNNKGSNSCTAHEKVTVPPEILITSVTETELMSPTTISNHSMFEFRENDSKQVLLITSPGNHEHDLTASEINSVNKENKRINFNNTMKSKDNESSNVVAQREPMNPLDYVEEKQMKTERMLDYKSENLDTIYNELGAVADNTGLNNNNNIHYIPLISNDAIKDITGFIRNNQSTDILKTKPEIIRRQHNASSLQTTSVTPIEHAIFTTKDVTKVLPFATDYKVIGVQSTSTIHADGKEDGHAVKELLPKRPDITIVFQNHNEINVKERESHNEVPFINDTVKVTIITKVDEIPTVTDSMKYIGNDLVSSLITSSTFQNSRPKDDVMEDVSTTVSRLPQTINNRSSIEELKVKTNENTSNKTIAEDTTKLILEVAKSTEINQDGITVITEHNQGVTENDNEFESQVQSHKSDDLTNADLAIKLKTTTALTSNTYTPDPTDFTSAVINTGTDESELYNIPTTVRFETTNQENEANISEYLSESMHHQSNTIDPNILTTTTEVIYVTNRVITNNTTEASAINLKSNITSKNNIKAYTEVGNDKLKKYSEHYNLVTSNTIEPNKIFSINGNNVYHKATTDFMANTDSITVKHLTTTAEMTSKSDTPTEKVNKNKPKENHVDEGIIKLVRKSESKISRKYRTVPNKSESDKRNISIARFLNLSSKPLIQYTVDTVGNNKSHNTIHHTKATTIFDTDNLSSHHQLFNNEISTEYKTRNKLEISDNGITLNTKQAAETSTTTIFFKPTRIPRFKTGRKNIKGLFRLGTTEPNLGMNDGIKVTRSTINSYGVNTYEDNAIQIIKTYTDRPTIHHTTKQKGIVYNTYEPTLEEDLDFEIDGTLKNKASTTSKNELLNYNVTAVTSKIFKNTRKTINTKILNNTMFPRGNHFGSTEFTNQSNKSSMQFEIINYSKKANRKKVNSLSLIRDGVNIPSNVINRETVPSKMSGADHESTTLKQTVVTKLQTTPHIGGKTSGTLSDALKDVHLRTIIRDGKNSKKLTLSPIRAQNTLSCQDIQNIVTNTVQELNDLLRSANCTEEVIAIPKSTNVSQQPPVTAKIHTTEQSKIVNRVTKLEQKKINRIVEYKKSAKRGKVFNTNKNILSSAALKKIKKLNSNSEPPLVMFGNTNLHPIKMMPQLTQRKIMNRIHHKEIMTMNTADFFSQKRFVTQRNIVKEKPRIDPRPFYLNNLITPVPRQLVLRPKFNNMDGAAAKYFHRPQAMYSEDFGMSRNRIHPKSLSWKHKANIIKDKLIKQKVPPTYNEQKVPINVLGLPPKRPRFIRDRQDTINDYFRNADAMSTILYQEPNQHVVASPFDVSNDAETLELQSPSFDNRRSGLRLPKCTTATIKATTLMKPRRTEPLALYYKHSGLIKDKSWSTHRPVTKATILRHGPLFLEPPRLLWDPPTQRPFTRSKPTRRSRRTIFFLNPTIPSNHYF